MLLDPQRTFASLLVSAPNRPAVRVVKRALTDVPSRPNPILVIGPTASGKTHLLHAAANSLATKQPAHAMQLLTAEAFSNRFVADVIDGRISSFRDGLLKSSTLFLDAMEDTATRETAASEIDNIVNTLIERGRTVILTLGATDYEHRARLSKMIESYPRGRVLRWYPAPLPVRLAAMQRILRARKQRLPEHTLVALARIYPTIPEASAALHRTLLVTSA